MSRPFRADEGNGIDAASSFAVFMIPSSPSLKNEPLRSRTTRFQRLHGANRSGGLWTVKAVEILDRKHAKLWLTTIEGDRLDLDERWCRLQDLDIKPVLVVPPVRTLHGIWTHSHLLEAIRPGAVAETVAPVFLYCSLGAWGFDGQRRSGSETLSQR